MKDGNRNDTVARITGKLINGGFTDEEIISILKPHAENVGFPIDELVTEVIGLCKRYPKDTSTPQLPYTGLDVEIPAPVRIADKPEPPPQEFILGDVLPKNT